MDNNDFIFSDDVAESLGTRTAGPEGELSSENGDSPDDSGKAGLHFLGSFGLAVMSLLAFLEHQIRV
jgi:hypothetical protein